MTDNKGDGYGEWEGYVQRDKLGQYSAQGKALLWMPGPDYIKNKRSCSPVPEVIGWTGQ